MLFRKMNFRKTHLFTKNFFPIFAPRVRAPCVLPRESGSLG